MKFLSILLVCLLATVAGCGGEPSEEVRAQSPDTEMPRVERDLDEPDDDREPRTAIVRALMDTLDRIDAEDEGEAFEGLDRDELREILLEADAELDRSLADNPLENILRANRRRPPIIVRPDRYLAPVEPGDEEPLESVPGEPEPDALPAPPEAPELDSSVAPLDSERPI